jgi:hypothetical protein
MPPKKGQEKIPPLGVCRERLLDYVIELGANGIYMIQPGPTEDPACLMLQYLPKAILAHAFQ